MTVISIEVTDESNPVELNAWLVAHPTAVVNFVLNDGRVFFIWHTL
jgi:hypothetical protein